MQRAVRRAAIIHQLVCLVINTDAGINKVDVRYFMQYNQQLVT